jgi:RNA polymerase sigma-B factor
MTSTEPMDEAPRDDEAEFAAWFERLPDPAARDELARRFRPLAKYLARRFAGRGENLDDLTQVASIGLLNAIDRFDPDRDVRFSTYASATIVGELKRHFRDKGWAVRVPRRLQELAVALNRATPLLTGSLGRPPSVPELAEHLDVEPEDIVEAMDAAQAYSASSLDTPVGESGLAPVDTMGEDSASMELVEEWVSLAPALERLPARDRRVLYLRFFQGLTQSEIAADIGVSQMHVSRILTSSLARLREDLSPKAP